MSAPHGQRVPEAFFLATDNGSRYCLYHRPSDERPVRRPVLYLHPFAEELNTTRRVVARQARALAASGHPVLQIDLYGCGDSEGVFADATWATWLSDARLACDWLTQRNDRAPWLWGCRSGALLSCALMASLPASLAHTPDLLWWQPVHSGAIQLQQFLRLGLAQQWTRSDRSSEPAASQRPNAGAPVEIAGYSLSQPLAKDLTSARLAPSARSPGGKLIWVDVTQQANPVPSSRALELKRTWEAAGWDVAHSTVKAPAFWQTVGLEEAPELMQVTLDALAASETDAA
ncbi:MAG: hydrolase 2, exosortase A system-associated [Comamonadaceae bacterium]|nr:hydrolase 2, exosortase A system-associated [Comamonadaceae bacterium]